MGAVGSAATDDVVFVISFPMKPYKDEYLDLVDVTYIWLSALSSVDGVAASATSSNEA
jgi:hypothetical protein